MSNGNDTDRPDPRALPSRTLPALWTPEHLRARDRLAREGKDVSALHAEWLEVRTVLEDTDGWPIGVAAHRLPVVGPVSGCTCGWTHEPRPPLSDNDFRLHYDGDQDDGPGDPVPLS